jgi:hypothetical protein
LERIHRAPVHEAKITSVTWNLKACYPFKYTVKRKGKEFLCSRLSGTSSTLPVDYIVAVAPISDHLWDKLRWILQVCIQNNDYLASCLIQSTGNRSLVPEVAGESDRLNKGVFLRVRLEQRPRSVFATIVYKHNLNGA